MANEPDNLILLHLGEIRATLAEHSARFDRIDERFIQMDLRFAQIDERFIQMDLRFAQIDERFTQMDLRFAQIDERFTQMDLRFSQIDERFTQMDLRFAQMDKRFDRMEQRFDDLHEVVSHTFVLSSANSLKVQELDRRYQLNEGEQQRISGRVDELDHRLSEVEKRTDE
jgi:predicted nuclease with TOPRIM domain